MPPEDWEKFDQMRRSVSRAVWISARVWCDVHNFVTNASADGVQT